ncbi:MAG: small subunit ribosomal protein S20 [bacterium]|jgi:small subunit ribosomal protein S20
MANHASAEKRNRQNIKRNLRNRALTSAYRTELKKFAVLVESDVEAAKAALPAIHKIIDKAFSKGLFKKETVSRKKSRMTVLLNKAIAG